MENSPLSSTPSPASNTSGETGRLAIVKNYEKSIPDKLALLAKLIDDVQLNPNHQTIQSLREAVHKLAGSAGTYGFMRVSELCLMLELDLVNRLSGKKEFNPADPNWLNELNIFLNNVTENFKNHTSQKEVHKAPIAESQNRKSIYVVDTNLKFLESIDKIKNETSFHVTCESDPEEAYKCISNENFLPHIVVLGDFILDSDNKNLNFLDLIKHKKQQIPIIVGLILHKENLEKRMIALQNGIRFIFKRPISVKSILKELESIEQDIESKKLRVLIVDDDPEICLYISTTLKEIGAEVKSIHDGIRLYDTLRSFEPDIILMDVLMPGYDGISLLRSLRADIKYKHLIIVIITSKRDEETFEKILEASPDDIIYKPLDKQKLLTRIQTLKKRLTFQLVSQGKKTDHVTGLMTSKAFFNTVQEVFPYLDAPTLVLFQINHFEEIEKRAGLNVITELLIEISNFLIHNLEKGRLCAYLEEGKFAILFEKMPPQELQKKIYDLLLELSREIQTSMYEDYILSLSAGISPFLSTNIKNTLLAANQALQEATQDEIDFVKVITSSAKHELNDLTKEIVIIDDDVDLTTVLAYSLEAHGFAVKVFHTGKEGLNYLLELDHTPMPLLILDHLLPDIDGIEVLKKLKLLLPHEMPVIFLSSLGSEKDIYEGLKEGAIDYITKPFNLNITIQKIIGICSHSKQNNQYNA